MGKEVLSYQVEKNKELQLQEQFKKNPKILLLDEASSSLDLKTELKIQKNIAQLSRNRTIISIAHRLTSIQNFDKILFLKGGKVIEKGNHKYLIDLKKKNISKMWMSQKINFK